MASPKRVREPVQKQVRRKTMRKIVGTIAAMLAIAMIMATSAGPARTGVVDDEIDAYSYSYAGSRAKR
jgi:hypothetical protein